MISYEDQQLTCGAMRELAGNVFGVLVVTAVVGGMVYAGLLLMVAGAS